VAQIKHASRQQAERPVDMRAGVIGGEEHMTNSRLCVLIELARIAVADPLPDLGPRSSQIKKGHR